MARKPAEQAVSREDILHAAAEVLRRNGYEGTTMKDIAAQVNLTAASLYHHFENKDVLLLAVLELGLRYVAREIESIVNDSSLTNVEKLRRIVHIHIANQTENRPAGVAMVYEVRHIVAQQPRGGLSDETIAEYNARRASFSPNAAGSRRCSNASSARGSRRASSGRSMCRSSSRRSSVRTTGYRCGTAKAAASAENRSLKKLLNCL